MTIQVDGVNSAPGQKDKMYDHHCPLLPGGKNMFKVSCESRKKNKELATCYGGCRADKIDDKARRRDKITSEEIIAIETMAESGASQIRIATELDLDKSTVSRILAREASTKGNLNKN